MKPIVSVLMGSSSDLEIMQKAYNVLDALNIEYEKKVISAHRTPDLAHTYATNAKASGIEVIIAGAGGAAHLAGVLAAYTTLPVIGVPISSKLNGLDSLLSTVSMPAGIPVATVGIDNATNAALLAASILSLKHPLVSDALDTYRRNQTEKVLNTVI